MDANGESHVIGKLIANGNETSKNNGSRDETEKLEANDLTAL